MEESSSPKSPYSPQSPQYVRVPSNSTTPLSSAISKIKGFIRSITLSALDILFPSKFFKLAKQQIKETAEKKGSRHAVLQSGGAILLTGLSYYQQFAWGGMMLSLTLMQKGDPAEEVVIPDFNYVFASIIFLTYPARFLKKWQESGELMDFLSCSTSSLSDDERAMNVSEESSPMGLKLIQYSTGNIAKVVNIANAGWIYLKTANNENIHLQRMGLALASIEAFKNFLLVLHSCKNPKDLLRKSLTWPKANMKFSQKLFYAIYLLFYSAHQAWLDSVYFNTVCSKIINYNPLSFPAQMIEKALAGVVFYPNLLEANIMIRGEKPFHLTSAIRSLPDSILAGMIFTEVLKEETSAASYYRIGAGVVVALFKWRKNYYDIDRELTMEKPSVDNNDSRVIVRIESNPYSRFSSDDDGEFNEASSFRLSPRKRILSPKEVTSPPGSSYHQISSFIISPSWKPDKKGSANLSAALPSVPTTLPVVTPSTTTPSMSTSTLLSSSMSDVLSSSTPSQTSDVSTETMPVTREKNNKTVIMGVS